MPGVRGPDRLLEERRHRRCLRRLGLGAIALAGDASGLHGHRQREADDEDEDAARRRHRGAVPPHELARAVGGARGAGDDGLVAQMATDVEPPQDDPVEVAAETPAQGDRVAAPGRRDPVDLGQDQPRNVARPRAIDRLAKGMVIGRSRDQVVEQGARVTDELSAGVLTVTHGKALLHRPAPAADRG